MKKQKRLDRTAALALIQNTPKVALGEPQKRETLASWTQGYDAEEQRKQEDENQRKFAGVRAAENALNETLQKARAQQAAALFNQESDELKSRCKNIVDDQFAEMSVEQCRQMIREAFDSFRTTLEETQGVRLEATALQKLQAISHKNLGIDLTDANVWWRLYEHANELGVFSDRDVTSIRVAAPSAQEQSSDPLAEMMNQPDTREGSRRATELSNEAYWSGEAAEMYQKWAQHLYDTWGVTLTEPQKQAVISWFMKWNKSFTRYESWNECRRALVAAQILDSSMITADEALSQALESTTVSLDNREARQDFIRRSRIINERQ